MFSFPILVSRDHAYPFLLKLPTLNNVARPYYPLPFHCCCHLLTFKSCSFISWRLYLTFILSYNSIISLRHNFNNHIAVLPHVLAFVFLDLIPSSDIVLYPNVITHPHSHILHLIITKSCNFYLISVPSMPILITTTSYLSSLGIPIPTSL